MGMSSRISNLFESQTAMDKLALSLVWMSMSGALVSLNGLAVFFGNVALCAWIYYQKNKHKEKMTNFS